MKFSIKLSCAAIVCLAGIASSSLHASEASHMAAANEMVDALKMDKMLDSMYSQINTFVINNVLSNDNCFDSIKQPLIDLLTQYNKKMLSPDTFRKEIQLAYKQEFTEEELRQIVAFYKTPAGQKALDKAGVLAAKGMEIAQREIEKSKQAGVMDELQKKIKDMIDNMDTSKLSPECKTKLEERKIRMKVTEEAMKAEKERSNAPAPSTSGSSLSPQSLLLKPVPSSAETASVSSSVTAPTPAGKSASASTPASASSQASTGKSAPASTTQAPTGKSTSSTSASTPTAPTASASTPTTSKGKSASLSAAASSAAASTAGAPTEKSEKSEKSVFSKTPSSSSSETAKK